MRRPTPPPITSPGHLAAECVTSDPGNPKDEPEESRTLEAVGTGRSEPEPFITVSIPYFKARGYIRRAVNSILAQPHRRLRVVVVNDGDRVGPWRELADIADPRLVRFDHPENRNRYFADAVVLAATPDDWFATQDADDWSEPDRLERLIQRAQQFQCRQSFTNRRPGLQRGRNPGPIRSTPPWAVRWTPRSGTASGIMRCSAPRCCAPWEATLPGIGWDMTPC